MGDPTDADLETAKDVLSWLLDETREHAPWAGESINSLEEALMEIPDSAAQFKADMKEDK